ncbi:ABC transporter ATP-binding protein [Limnobacter sp.]|uniref:ABC transporter ATP-binding protein n=1 Tax=Limnobacter sp. TaxID=2003368 RepID=UPI003518D953
MSLKAIHVSAGYGPCAVLEQVHLEVRPGQALCVLGPNGSGKSALLKTLLGLLPTLAGEVHINGQTLATLPNAERARLLAYVPQNQGLSFQFTVHDVVLMGRTFLWGLLQGPSSNDLREVRQHLDMLGIANLEHRPFQALSGGQQQLVLIARALYQGARCLVMDEPTANLDVANASLVLNTTLALCQSAGLSMVFSSHNPQDALTHNTQALLIKNRRVLAQGPARQVLNANLLTDLYGVQAQVHALQPHPVVVWL